MKVFKKGIVAKYTVGLGKQEEEEEGSRKRRKMEGGSAKEKVKRKRG